jgi:hypothetical protein
MVAPWLRHSQRVFLVVALLAAAQGVYAWASVGAENAPVLFRDPRLRDPSWSLWIAAAALVLACLPRPSTVKEESQRLWRVLEALSPAVAYLVGAALLLCIWHCGSFVAAGSDSSGYLSQARLWLRGEIVVQADPLMYAAPWPDAEWTFMSLGYCPGTQPGTFVPTYAAGLPLLMAAAELIAGPTAAFSIVPLTGLLLLASAYSLGRCLAGPVAGAMATALVASSPIVLFMVFLPMSDLPAAAFWVAATAVAARSHRTSPLLAGLLASLAILVRPNLAAVALPLAAFVAYRVGSPRAAQRALLWLAAGLAPGVALTAAINATLYGSPLRSGYGSLADVFAWRHFPLALAAYPARATATHTVLIGLALLAPFVLGRSPQLRARSTSLFLLAMAAVLFLSYAFYPPFDNWTYLRFVTGSIVWLLILTSAVLVLLIRRLPLWAGAPAVLLCTVLLVGLLLERATLHGVFSVERDEQRFLATAQWVNEHLPQRAALICMQHSGSLRYYTARPILRWDLLPPHKLDRALRFLRERGYSPYIVLDCVGETKAFAANFYGHSGVAQLDWPARVRVLHGGCVRVFDPADRARCRAGEVLITEQVR